MPDRIVYANSDTESHFRRAGLADHDALARTPALGPPIASSRTSVTSAVVVAGLPAHRKIYRYPTARDLARGALRGTLLGAPRAIREWRALIALTDAGHPVVRPLVVSVRRRLGLVRETILLTHSEPGARTLDRVLREGGPSRERLAAVRETARAVAAIHDGGFTLGDPALRDVLILPAAGGVRLVDIPRLRSVRHVSPRAGARDLARIGVGLRELASVRETMRALATYRRARGMTSAHGREIARGARQARGTRMSEREVARLARG